MMLIGLEPHRITKYSTLTICSKVCSSQLFNTEVYVPPILHFCNVKLNKPPKTLNAIYCFVLFDPSLVLTQISLIMCLCAEYCNRPMAANIFVFLVLHTLSTAIYHTPT